MLLDNRFPFGQFAIRAELAGHAIDGDRISVVAQPSRYLERDLTQFRFALLGDDGSTFHQNSARRRNSRFPSLPRIGVSIPYSPRPPSTAPPSRTFPTPP